MKPFLTANWTNLINITYAVNPELLKPYLPNNVTLDTIDGKAFLSFVPFDFTDIKFLGMKIPFHINFPEINIRFYVHHNGNSGVVFLKEFVSKPMIINIANNFYYEHYEYAQINNKCIHQHNNITVSHCIKKREKKFNVEVSATDDLYFPDKGSKEYFFEERFYGYSKNKIGSPLQFRVEHPSWGIYPVKNYSIDFDYGFLMGEEWTFLNNTKPECVMLLNGSFVKMYPHKKI